MFLVTQIRYSKNEITRFGDISGELYKYFLNQIVRKHVNSGSTKKKSITIVGMGTFYKKGVFSGDIGNTFSSYQNFRPFAINIISDDVYGDFGMALIGKLDEINKAKFLDEHVDGDFYGTYVELYISLGKKIFEKKHISLIPTVSVSYFQYEMFTIETKLFKNPNSRNHAINGNYYNYYNDYNLISLGPGIIADLNFWKPGKSTFSLSLRLRYNALFVVEESQFKRNGIINDFSVGIVFSIGPFLF